MTGPTRDREGRNSSYRNGKSPLIAWTEPVALGVVSGVSSTMG